MRRRVAFFWYADAAKPENMDLARDFLNAMQGIRQAEAMEKEGEEGEQGEELEEGERRDIKDLKRQRSS